jgi:hypothetical protein
MVTIVAVAAIFCMGVLNKRFFGVPALLEKIRSSAARGKPMELSGVEAIICRNLNLHGI